MARRRASRRAVRRASRRGSPWACEIRSQPSPETRTSTRFPARNAISISWSGITDAMPPTTDPSTNPQASKAMPPRSEAKRKPAGRLHPGNLVHRGDIVDAVFGPLRFGPPRLAGRVRIEEPESTVLEAHPRLSAFDLEVPFQYACRCSCRHDLILCPDARDFTRTTVTYGHSYPPTNSVRPPGPRAGPCRAGG